MEYHEEDRHWQKGFKYQIHIYLIYCWLSNKFLIITYRRSNLKKVVQLQRLHWLGVKTTFLIQVTRLREANRAWKYVLIGIIPISAKTYLFLKITKNI